MTVINLLNYLKQECTKKGKNRNIPSPVYQSLFRQLETKRFWLANSNIATGRKYLVCYLINQQSFFLSYL